MKTPLHVGPVMIPYLLVFIGSLAVDCIPVFAPPAWMLMLYLMMKFQLQAPLVAVVGALGSVAGRMIYMTYIVPWIKDKTIARDKKEDLEFVGKKISQKGPATLFFVFLYSVLPLSTTALFTAAGLAKVKRRYLIPAFFLGKLISDYVLLFSGKYVVDHFDEIFKESLSPKSILIMAAALFFVLIFLFLDWRTLLQERKVKIKWNIWK
jgi:membrane protein DedA with SNARE-associated domain